MRHSQRRRKRIAAIQRARTATKAQGAHSICRGHTSRKRTPLTKDVTTAQSIGSDTRKVGTVLNGAFTRLNLYCNCDLPQKRAFSYYDSAGKRYSR